MYLMIENENEAPLESFTVFGASTSRGQENSIGQFGSGAKFGTLVCMRHNINPIIYSGRNRIQFFSEPMELKGKTFSRVCYTHGNKTEKTSYTLEFGELDWDDCKMGLREFVSNAIDGAEGDISKVKIEVTTNDPRAKSGKTRVFIPLVPDVQEFYRTIGDRFLHFNKGRGSGKVYGVLSKIENGPANIFLKGVLVRSMTKKESLFDYNFKNELKIDEARNMEEYSVRYAMEKVLGKTDDIKTIDVTLDTIVKGSECEETSFGSYALRSTVEQNKLWKDRFYAKYGSNAVIFNDALSIFAKTSEGKGFRPIHIKSNGWFESLKSCGVPEVISVLDNVNDKGHIIKPACKETMECAKRVWDSLVDLDMHKNKSMPEVVNFVDHMDGEKVTGGYYKDSKVYINSNNPSEDKIMMEEFAHYITGSRDNSRDFQDFAFSLATKAVNIVRELTC